MPKVVAKTKPNIQFSQAFKSAVRDTVNYIAADAMEGCEDNYCLLEMVMDANRLLTCGQSQEAEDELHELLKTYKFDQIIHALEAQGFNYI